MPQSEGPAKNLELFQKALSFNTYGNPEIREQFLNAASETINLNIPVEVKEKFIILGREEMQKQIDKDPLNLRHQVFMGSFLNRLRLYNDALPYLEKALVISPKRQQTHFEFVTNYLNSNQVPKALDFAKKAFELDKNFNIPRLIYVTTLIYAGEQEFAESLLIEKFGTAVFGDERLARAYFDVSEMQKSILIWKKLIESNPNNIQYRTSLAGAYLGGGLRKEAVNEIRKAIEIEPNFKEQGEFFIREIEAGRNP